MHHLKGYECIKILIAIRLKRLKGLMTYKESVAWKRKIVFPLFRTINVCGERESCINKSNRSHDTYRTCIKDCHCGPHAETTEMESHDYGIPSWLFIGWSDSWANLWILGHTEWLHLFYGTCYYSLPCPFTARIIILYYDFKSLNPL